MKRGLTLADIAEIILRGNAGGLSSREVAREANDSGLSHMSRWSFHQAMKRHTERFRHDGKLFHIKGALHGEADGFGEGEVG